MAFTDAERVQIRRFMGGSFLFIMYDPRLESAMDTVTALPDSGATEDYITDTLLVALAATETSLAGYRCKFIALEVDEAKVDVVRAMGALRSEGRRYSTQLAQSLGFNAPIQDCWSGAEPDVTQQLGDRGGTSPR